MKKTILSLKNASLITKDELKKINGGNRVAACYQVICNLTQTQCNEYARFKQLVIHYEPSNGCCTIEDLRC